MFIVDIEHREIIDKMFDKLALKHTVIYGKITKTCLYIVSEIDEDIFREFHEKNAMTSVVKSTRRYSNL